MDKRYRGVPAWVCVWSSFPTNYVPGKRYPFVIQTRGFDEHEFLVTGLTATATSASAMAAQPLASEGFVVIQTSMPRGELSRQGEASYAGYKAIIDRLDREGLIDVCRIGMTGFSASGFHVLYALTRPSSFLATGVMAEGMTGSFGSAMMEMDSKNNFIAKYAEAVGKGTLFGEGQAAFAANAPSMHLENVHVPLRLYAHRGTFSLMLWWDLYAGLRYLHKPVDFIWLPDAYHNVEKPLERYASQQGTVDWYRFWLKHEEDPDPSKAEQCRRWRAMRQESGPSEAVACRG